MTHRAARWLAPASTAIALAALSAFPGWAVAGNHGWGGQTVAIMAVPVQTQQVQTQYVTTTPVVATTPVFVGRAPLCAPLFATRAQLMTVNSVAAPTTMTSYVTTASPMVTTSYVVQAPATVTTTAPILTTSAQGTTSTTSPQVNVSQSGQTLTLTITGTSTANPNVATSLTQGLVGESVAASDAPYLTSILDGAGRGTIAGLIKAALRKFMQSLGPNGTNKDLLKQIATFFLQNAFGGNFAFDLNKALPEIDTIINSLLNEQKGGGGNGGGGGSGGTLPPGTYQFQGTFTIGGGGGPNVTPPPLPPVTPPQPPPSGASNPGDKDLHPSKSPFGTSSP